MQHIANHNFQDAQGNSYLHLACFRHCVEAIEVLLKIGANPNLRNNNGIIPLLLLYSPNESTNADILDLMLQHGLDLNIRFSNVYRNETLKEILDN